MSRSFSTRAIAMLPQRYVPTTRETLAGSIASSPMTLAKLVFKYRLRHSFTKQAPHITKCCYIAPLQISYIISRIERYQHTGTLRSQDKYLLRVPNTESMAHGDGSLMNGLPGVFNCVYYYYYILVL